jgi:hypothetical protein
MPKRYMPRFCSNPPCDRYYTVLHLRSSAAQLAAIAEALQTNPNYEPLQFKADMTNAYRHLNQAWNSRTWSAHRLSPKRSAASQARDNKKLEQLPTDIWLHDPYGDKPTPSYGASQVPLALPKEIPCTLFHLRDSKVQINNIANDLHSRPKSTDAFTGHIEHAYHHLNYAWNTRHLESDEAWGGHDEEFYELREMPVDISFDELTQF